MVKLTESRYESETPCSKCGNTIRYRTSGNCVVCHLANKRRHTRIVDGPPCSNCAGTKWYESRRRWCVNCQNISYSKRDKEAAELNISTGLHKLLCRKF